MRLCVGLHSSVGRRDECNDELGEHIACRVGEVGFEMLLGSAVYLLSSLPTPGGIARPLYLERTSDPLVVCCSAHALPRPTILGPSQQQSHRSCHRLWMRAAQRTCFGVVLLDTRRILIISCEDRVWRIQLHNSLASLYTASLESSFPSEGLAEYHHMPLIFVMTADNCAPLFCMLPDRHGRNPLQLRNGPLANRGP